MVVTSSNLKTGKNIFPFLTVFLLFFPAVLHAQTADLIQTLLRTDAVSYEQAANFVLEAAELTGLYDKADERYALRSAVEKKWLPQNADAPEPITLEGLSHLIMKAFNLKGGLFFTLVNSAHYSYRELVYRDVIQGRSDPQMKVSGEKMLFIVNRLLYLEEEAK